MIELSEWLLTSLLNHGSSMLAATLFLAALGVPLPATMLLIAAGAFAGQGVLPIGSALVAAVSGAVAGDACSYLVGRYTMRWVPQRLLVAAPWTRASALFGRWGGWSIFLTRFLLTPIAFPVNILAGSTRYAVPRFMSAVVGGEIIWVLLYGGLGHTFFTQWEAISRIAGDIAGLAIGIALAVAGAWLAFRHARGKAT